MKSIKVAIADENQVYSKGLSEYLQSEYGQAFDISCFTNIKSLTEHLSTDQQIDILLIDQKLYNESLKTHKVKTILLLTENVMENEVDGFLALYKYQLGDKISKNILQYYDSSVNERFNVHIQPQNSKLIAVYSPAGGTGKSTIAYNISLQYALQGKKAILISMESYASLPIFKAESKSCGLSYLTYLIKNKTNNLQVKLDAIKELDSNTNIYYIPRDSHSLELKDADKDDIALLLEFFRVQSGYDAVILDMDSAISEKLLNVFKHCDVLLNVTGNDFNSKEKYKSFTEQLRIFGDLLGVDLAKKIITVNNKVMGQLSDKVGELRDERNAVEIPFLADNCFMENGYYPELAHFKQLFDVVENFFADKREEA